MARFPAKKKANDTAAVLDERKVYDLAAAALREKRATTSRLPFRLHLSEALMNRFSNKAVVQMLEKIGGNPMPREQKDLTKDFENSIYRNTAGHIVIPCAVIKACIVEGAITTSKVVSKAELKRDLRILGHTAPLRLPEGKSVTMDIRVVRNMNGAPDIRARALIPAGTTLDIVAQFPLSLTADKVISAMEGAGHSLGLLDFRPQNGGNLGTFEVELLPYDEIERIMRENAIPEEPMAIPPELLRSYNARLKEGNVVELPSAVTKMIDAAARRVGT